MSPGLTPGPTPGLPLASGHAADSQLGFQAGGEVRLRHRRGSLVRGQSGCSPADSLTGDAAASWRGGKCFCRCSCHTSTYGPCGQISNLVTRRGGTPELHRVLLPSPYSCHVRGLPSPRGIKRSRHARIARSRKRPIQSNFLRLTASSPLCLLISRSRHHSPSPPARGPASAPWPAAPGRPPRSGAVFGSAGQLP
jgi:hypothetical protein